VDVHGGWFDATGDKGVHMSHLSHGHWFNPQQASFSAYVFYRVLDLLSDGRDGHFHALRRKLLDEGSYGADWLMRARSPSGSFYSPGPMQGDAYDPAETGRRLGLALLRRGPGVQGASDAAGAPGAPDVPGAPGAAQALGYEASLRSGAGYAIAALAAAARRPYPSAAHSGQEYLGAAKAAYFHLEAHNGRYASDGKWNIIDEFCALDALTELYRTSGEEGFLRRARAMAERVEGRYRPVTARSGYFAADDGDRPFFSASDEGAPVLALLNYRAAEPDGGMGAKALRTCEMAMRFAASLADEEANPFGYARMFYQARDGRRGTQFFFPHDTEVAPWWQGDNARILSLACAARCTSRHTRDSALARRLGVYADDQLAWVLGLNPFDCCMLGGAGRHNVDYFYNGRYDFVNAPGGVANGVTAGLADPDGICFVTSPEDFAEVEDNWRWAEQWLPHASWLLYAVAMPPG
jgi:hypothetical protein